MPERLSQSVQLHESLTMHLLQVWAQRYKTDNTEPLFLFGQGMTSSIARHALCGHGAYPVSEVGASGQFSLDNFS